MGLCHLGWSRIFSVLVVERRVGNAQRLRLLAGGHRGKWLSLRLLYISIVLSGDDVWCRSAKERRARAWWSMGILFSIEAPGATGDVIRDSVSDI